jgi:hypothetical protein
MGSVIIARLLFSQRVPIKQHIARKNRSREGSVEPKVRVGIPPSVLAALARTLAAPWPVFANVIIQLYTTLLCNFFLNAGD